MLTGYADRVGTRKTVRRGRTEYWMVKTGAGWEYEHRVVVAERLGRALERDEIVHHKDGDGVNNEAENLDLLSPGEHTQEHHTITTWARTYDACRGCGATHRKHLGGGLCSCCYQRQPGKSWKDWRARHARRDEGQNSGDDASGRARERDSRHAE